MKITENYLKELIRESFFDFFRRGAQRVDVGPFMEVIPDVIDRAHEMWGGERTFETESFAGRFLKRIVNDVKRGDMLQGDIGRLINMTTYALPRLVALRLCKRFEGSGSYCADKLGL